MDTDFYHEMSRFLERRSHETGAVDAIWTLCGAELWYVGAWRKRGALGAFLGLMMMPLLVGTPLSSNNKHAALTACLLLDESGASPNFDLEEIYTRFLGPHDFQVWRDARRADGILSNSFRDFYKDLYGSVWKFLITHHNVARAVLGVQEGAAIRSALLAGDGVTPQSGVQLTGMEKICGPDQHVNVCRCGNGTRSMGAGCSLLVWGRGGAGICHQRVGMSTTSWGERGR